ncbi:MAG: hypothetical protein SOW18_00065 [Peptoniphilus sp.]|nr:hypothetical protein [Peptoniphilus sp.]MDY3117916.1 hypothetical protein [Peptoniphilus sp.]
MAYFLQIYISNYGAHARPVAYGAKGEGSFVRAIEATDETEDWISPLNRFLESFSLQNTLYLFRGQFETRCIGPYLTKKARERLTEAVDLYDAIKARTAIAPLPSYSMAALARMGDFDDTVRVAEEFSVYLKEQSTDAIERQIERNLDAMAAAHNFLKQLRRRLRRDPLEIESFHLHPFQIRGTCDENVRRYIQRDDLLYTEEDGQFTFDGPLKRLPYDDKRYALVLETDAPVVQSVICPSGFLLFALEDTVYYETILALLEWLREQGL